MRLALTAEGTKPISKMSGLAEEVVFMNDHKFAAIWGLHWVAGIFEVEDLVALLDIDGLALAILIQFARASADDTTTDGPLLS